MTATYGKWRVLKTLGQGGQGQVFLVEEGEQPGSKFVLKRLINLKRIERFRKEIEATASLNHENVVRLVDFDLDGPKPFLVVDYCEGGSLEDAEPFWRGDDVATLELFSQVLSGVQHAHLQGVIHRDIKPANVFLRSERGPAVVGDFGICFIDDDDGRVTLVDEAVGARLYMAPELEDGKAAEVTSAADVYSLGKLLYWLFTGRTFAREKHRDRQWDLRDEKFDTQFGFQHPLREHLNRIMDFMIVADPSERRRLGNISILVERWGELMVKGHNAIGRDVPQICTYCGQGLYRLTADDNITSVKNFGINAVGSPEWRIFVCKYCGHVAMFRIDNADGKRLWTEGKI